MYAANKCKMHRAEKLQIDQAITRLTSGPGEELLKELGDLLEEGEDCLERLLWANKFGGGAE
jgi:hypothetical protein